MATTTCATFDGGDIDTVLASTQGRMSARFLWGQILSGRDGVSPASSLDDGDGDNVSDGCDNCAGTPPGTQVGDDGCP